MFGVEANKIILLRIHLRKAILVEKKIKGFKVTDYNLSSHTFKHVISQVI
jgi:hypothetical protein